MHNIASRDTESLKSQEICRVLKPIFNSVSGKEIVNGGSEACEGLGSFLLGQSFV